RVRLRPPRAGFAQVRVESLGWGACGENSPAPSWLPALIPLVAMSQRGGDVLGSDNHHAVRFARLDALVGKRGSEVGKAPVLVLVRVDLDQPRQHHLCPDA